MRPFYREMALHRPAQSTKASPPGGSYLLGKRCIFDTRRDATAARQATVRAAVVEVLG